MKAHKRGLGRGLEVLLADPAYGAPSQRQPETLAGSQLNEHYRLLTEEAIQLKDLLDELADLLGNGDA